MSAARSSREPSGGTGYVSQPARNMTQLHARRRQARRRRRLARLDLGLGVLGALVLLIATPGLAITALVALLVLALCLLSVAVERRRRAR
jgi:hypothetical protein